MTADRRRQTVARSRLAWPLVLPLLAAGLLTGHDLAYRLVVVDPAERAHFLDRTGHAYLAYGSLLFALVAALAVVALVWRVSAALRGLSGASAPAWLFALLAPVAFMLQEHLERFVHDGAVPFDLALQPVFLVGLAVQVPFALGALLLARALESVAEAVAGAIARRAAGRPSATAPPGPAEPPTPPRLRPLALSRSVRGPPLAA